MLHVYVYSLRYGVSSVQNSKCNVLYLFYFFYQKVSPGGNTTFEVVFLARQVGNVENTLFIHTNFELYEHKEKYGSQMTPELRRELSDYTDEELYTVNVIYRWKK